MKTTMLILILLFTVTMLSCDENVIVEPEKEINNKIQKEFYYNYITDKIPLRLCKYIYDSEMKLEKKYHYSGNNTTNPYQYEIFTYNVDNKIINKNTYSHVNESIGWMLHDSTLYNYYNGKLITKETFYLTPYSDHIFYKYEYENSNLIKEFVSYNQQLESYTIYNYLDNNCVKETIFSDSLGTDTTKYIIHYYENNILSKSEKFTNKNKIQIITYTYDDEDNLTIKEAKQTDPTVVKQLYYVIRYVYK